jgi:hypothetical protein
MFREEVLNVQLAELLAERGVLSIPETIQRSMRGRRMPDITVGDFWGVRTVIEGRTSDTPNVEDSLHRDSMKRIEEGFAAICVAVVYPDQLRKVEFGKLKQEMAKARLRINVFTEAEEGEWTEGDVDSLSAVLRRAYEGMVRENVLEETEKELRAAIEEASGDLLESKAAPLVLRQIMGIPEETGEDEEEDEG